MPLPDPFNPEDKNIPGKVFGSYGSANIFAGIKQKRVMWLAAIIAVFAALAGIIISLL